MPDMKLQAKLTRAEVKPQRLEVEAEGSLEARVLAGGKFALHGSHHSRVFKGLFYCLRCGAYGSGRPRRLLTECKQPVPEKQRNALREVDKIKAGKLPSGLKCWPAEQQSGGEDFMVAEVPAAGRRIRRSAAAASS